MILTPTDMAKRNQTPPLQGRGKGWGLSANTLADLQGRARSMRNNPTEPEKRLWRNLSNGQLGGFKFRRQQVIGYYIADLLCASERLIVEVDGRTHDSERDFARDCALSTLGYRTLRVTNDDVLRNMAGVLQMILAALESADVALAAGPHPHPSPEGEGLFR